MPARGGSLCPQQHAAASLPQERSLRHGSAALRASPRLVLSMGARQRRHFSIPVPGSRGTVQR